MPEEEQSNSFLFAVERIRDGNLLSDLDNQLRELSSAVIVNEKGGKLTLTIEVKPPAKRAGSAVVLIAKSAVSLPQPDAAGRIFFVGLEDAALSLDNPDQIRMFPKETHQ